MTRDPSAFRAQQVLLVLMALTELMVLMALTELMVPMDYWDQLVNKAILGHKVHQARMQIRYYLAH